MANNIFTIILNDKDTKEYLYKEII